MSRRGTRLWKLGSLLGFMGKIAIVPDNHSYWARRKANCRLRRRMKTSSENNYCRIANSAQRGWGRSMSGASFFVPPVLTQFVSVVG